MRNRPSFLQYVLPVIILVAGFMGMRALVLSKTPPEKKERPQVGALVETAVLHSGDHRIEIHATGTVQPAMAVDIAPQVAGRVVETAPGFVEGGFFRKGDLLFAIEDADYRLAVDKSRAEIAQAEYEMASVESRARVARLEWERVQLDDKSQPNPLVLYEPQLKNARAALAGAQADLSQRLLNVQRTRIDAPFNCRVRSKSVDPGRFISAGQTVASVAGTDAAEILVPVPLEDLQWLDVPRRKDRAGSPAEVCLSAGDVRYAWQGVIVRSLGEVDAKSRMARLVVRVEDPYGLKKADGHRLDLADGMFVTVGLKGHTLTGVFTLPADALRNQETIWLVGKDRTLEIRPVQLIRREKGIVLVRDGIEDGSRLVLTHLSGAAQGMRLRLVEEDPS